MTGAQWRATSSRVPARALPAHDAATAAAANTQLRRSTSRRYVLVTRVERFDCVSAARGDRHHELERRVRLAETHHLHVFEARIAPGAEDVRLPDVLASFRVDDPHRRVVAHGAPHG